MNKRIEHIRETLKRDSLDAMIISDPTSIFYLTGASIFPFERMWLLLIKADGKDILFANKLFVFDETGVNTLWHGDNDNAPQILCDQLAGVENLAVDKTLCAKYIVPILDRYPKMKISLSGVVDSMRIIKDENELELMRKSSQINDMACQRALSRIHTGMTEKELASYVSEEYEKLGASGCCFETIAAFGANAADPHHESDNTVLHEGEAVLLDMGCYYKNYCSDMTRTVFYMGMTEKEQKVFDIVKEAAARAKALVKPGVRFCDIDAAARDYITENGYGEYFTHRLGHCIGLADHEPEDVGPVNENAVKTGMVFSIEPGIYLPGEFGVRLEDLVTVTEDGCEILNTLPIETNLHLYR